MNIIDQILEASKEIETEMDDYHKRVFQAFKEYKIVENPFLNKNEIMLVVGSDVMKKFRALGKEENVSKN